MSGIKGELCVTDELLEAAAKAKKKDYIERRTEKGEQLSPPWQLHKGTTWRRPKTPDEIFEDRIWLLLFNLGFKSLNVDRQCRLEYKAYTKQVDVLGRDDSHAFVVQCRTTESEENNISARGMLEEFGKNHDEIRKALEDYWGHGSFARVCHIVALGSREKRGIDEEHVQKNPQDNLHLWSLNDIEYMEQLVESVGPIARQQLYAVMLQNKRNSKIERICPAIKSRIGNRAVYNFLINAKDLADYVYVHHRKLSTLSEASQAYQRMLRPQKLKQIREFLDVDEGFFANNIILNFNRSLEWTRNKAYDSVEIGTIKLPGYYGCAWIIDGQHRLYGAASAKNDVLLPVIALEQISEVKQAELFVEINKKQTAVAGNLLWDLYSDIYRGSDQPREAKLWLISEIAKRISRDGPLHGQIEFESDLKTHKAPLTLNTVCTSIQQNCPWEILAPEGTPDQKAKNVARVINCFFTALISLRQIEWSDANANKIILTNNGYAVSFLLFSDIIKHFHHTDQKSLLVPSNVNRLTEEIQKLLQPAVEFGVNDAARGQAITKGTARGLQADNACELAKIINGFNKSFNPPRLAGLVAEQPEKSPLPCETVIRERAVRFEKLLRDFVLCKLIEWHGDHWWKHGMPGELKKELDEIWKKQASSSPELLNDPNPNEHKFGYCDITRVASVIKYGENWEGEEGGFVSIFPCDKNELDRRIRGVKAVRDATGHSREDTQQELLAAGVELRWFSQVLSDNSLNPYPA